MSDHSNLIARVAARNPVPNLDDPPIGAWDIDVVRATVTERDIAMLTDKRPTETSPPGAARRRGWQVALASFAIILLAVGGVWLGTRGPSDGQAGQPPTTNTPANEPERIAVETMVAYYTFNEAQLRTLSSALSPDVLAVTMRNMLFEGALNSRPGPITCTANAVANVSVSCTFSLNSDLLAALGIEDHPVEANIAVLDGGWKDFSIDLNIEAEPNFEAYVRDTDSGLFDEGGPCHWNPDIDPSTVDWDACAAASIEFIESWMAETGRG